MLTPSNLTPAPDNGHGTALPPRPPDTPQDAAQLTPHNAATHLMTGAPAADTESMTTNGERNPRHDMRRVSESPLTLAAPDPFQLVWMEELREHLRGPRIDLTVPDQVEQLFVDWCCRWHATTPAERWDPMPSLTALGVAVGDLVRAARPDLRWRVVADCNPTTLVLADAHDRAVASPITDIATWWISRELAGITVLLARLEGAAPAALPPQTRAAAPSRTSTHVIA